MISFYEGEWNRMLKNLLDRYICLVDKDEDVAIIILMAKVIINVGLGRDKNGLKAICF